MSFKTGQLVRFETKRWGNQLVQIYYSHNHVDKKYDFKQRPFGKDEFGVFIEPFSLDAFSWDGEIFKDQAVWRGVVLFGERLELVALLDLESVK